MNKLEQLHLEAIKMNTYPDSLWGDNYVAGVDAAASKSAEITGQIACEFAEWLGLNTIQTDNYLFQHNGIEKTIEELFQEFLKTKQ
jgi:hypothetical protein